MRQFIAERLEPDAGGMISNIDLFAAYACWATEHGAPTMLASVFGRFTSKLRMRKAHTGNQRFDRGLRFKPAIPKTLQ